MDYSDSTIANSHEVPEAHHRSVLRAVLSAATFGTLGALVGNWLGKHGNDRRTKFAQPMMKWSMGIFCGVLGAYSSFKASEHSEYEQVTEKTMAKKQSSLDELAPAEKTQIKAAKHDGKLVASVPHVALEK